jgi:hypothetical protein
MALQALAAAADELAVPADPRVDDPISVWPQNGHFIGPTSWDVVAHRTRSG